MVRCLLSLFLLHLNAILKYLHAYIVKSTTSKNVIPAAIKMILLRYPQIAIPINRANTKVKAINNGKASFLKVSTAQAMKQDNAINTTERIIIIGMLTNIVLNAGLL